MNHPGSTAARIAAEAMLLAPGERDTFLRSRCHGDTVLIDHVSKLIGELTASDDLNAEMLEATEPLAKWIDSLHGGDPEAGEAIFFNKTELSCVRCHQVDRAGGQVGPNLTVIGKTLDRRTLLGSICLPDARIAQGFETTVIAAEDGEVFTGIVALETDEVVELIAANGTRHQIEKELIVARKKGQSSMPAGLADLITPRQLRDLIAYLASLQVDPRAAPTSAIE